MIFFSYSPTFLILKMTILAAGDKVKKPVRTAMHYIEDLTKETTPMTNLPQLCTGYLPVNIDIFKTAKKMEK